MPFGFGGKKKNGGKKSGRRNTSIDQDAPSSPAAERPRLDEPAPAPAVAAAAAGGAAAGTLPPSAKMATLGGKPPVRAPRENAGPVTFDPSKRRKLRADPTGPLDEVMPVLRRKGGTAMTRFAPGRKPQILQCTFDLETLEITYPKNRSGLISIDVGEIREIRTGAAAIACKDFNADADRVNKVQRCLVIFHGMEFRLKQLCLEAPDDATFYAWTDALWTYTREANPELYHNHRALDCWIKRHWAVLDKSQRESLGLKEVKMWMSRINYKIGNKEIKELFTQVDKFKQAVIGLKNVKELYHLLADTPDVTDLFKGFASSASKMTSKDIVKFFHEQQGESSFTSDKANDVIRQYGDGESSSSIAICNFVEYLHSVENTAVSPALEGNIYQDLNHPLAHYFISSSHNTYLMGDQFKSESSTEAYVRCLRDGCRCVEIDCWDGPGNDPIVYHGHTLTTRIKFRDVLPAINEHAFVMSDYPLILSIENHCSLSQQQVMAEEFQKVFGDRLLTGPLDECNEGDRDWYPSPEQLKGKIIIKHKKLDKGSNEVATSQHLEDDLSSSIKNGHLLLEDKIDGSWTKHYFVLTDTKIFYAENQDDEDLEIEDVEDAEEEETEADSKQSELHYGEPWFHGRLRGGRVAAEQLLKEYQGEEGTFLVRESDTFPGEFSLSFWRNGAAQHCRIRCRESKYFLTDQISFINLYELIEYYRREPLKSAQFKMRLRDGVPQPAPHEDKKWFHKSLSRADAEDMLKRIRSDGAFLVRESESAQQAYAISFRAEGKIKHCRIRKEGRMYCIGDAEFESLVKLVEYYEKHFLYRKMKLKYPVDWALIERQGVDPDAESIYNSDDLYQEPNPLMDAAAKSTHVSCKALYAYRGTQPDELTFPNDAVITNIVKRDGGWWQGDYGDHKGGWLPSNYVEEIDHEALAQEDKDDSENPLGSLEKAVMDVAGLRVQPRPSTAQQRLIFRIISEHNPNNYLDVGAESEEDMRDWARCIATAALACEQADRQNVRLQKKMKIHKDLSDLVFYSQSVRFSSFPESKNAPYYHMSSFPERKCFSLCMERSGQPREFNEYNCRQLSRVYPNGKRVDSSNYDPQVPWNCGSQLVALNYQTPDKHMWLNNGKFRINGRCGFLLKPQVQREPSFNPYNHKSYQHKVELLNLKVTIISARHLVKSGKGTASPFVEVEVCGVELDQERFKTSTVSDNGFCPSWNETVTFSISLPELAALRINVCDEDMFGDANTIGQAVIPLGSSSECSLRTGYRSVPLRNAFSEQLQLSTLLMHFEVRYGTSGHEEDYQSLQELRAQMIKTSDERQQLIKKKVLASKSGQGLDQAAEEELQKLNADIREIETKLMANPVEKSRADESAKQVNKKAEHHG